MKRVRMLFHEIDLHHVVKGRGIRHGIRVLHMSGVVIVSRVGGRGSGHVGLIARGNKGSIRRVERTPGWQRLVVVLRRNAAVEVTITTDDSAQGDMRGRYLHSSERVGRDRLMGVGRMGRRHGRALQGVGIGDEEMLCRMRCGRVMRVSGIGDARWVMKARVWNEGGGVVGVVGVFGILGEGGSGGGIADDWVGTKNVILLLNYGVNFMLVILLVCSGGFFLFELFLEFVKGLELAVGPSGDTVLTALLFEGGDADTEFTGGGVNGEMKESGEILIGEGATAGGFLGRVWSRGGGWRRIGSGLAGGLGMVNRGEWGGRM